MKNKTPCVPYTHLCSCQMCPGLRWVRAWAAWGREKDSPLIFHAAVLGCRTECIPPSIGKGEQHPTSLTFTQLLQRPTRKQTWERLHNCAFLPVSALKTDMGGEQRGRRASDRVHRHRQPPESRCNSQPSSPRAACTVPRPVLPTTMGIQPTTHSAEEPTHHPGHKSCINLRSSSWIKASFLWWASPREKNGRKVHCWENALHLRISNIITWRFILPTLKFTSTNNGFHQGLLHAEWSLTLPLCLTWSTKSV